MNVIEIKNVTKSFGNKKVLDNISLSVQEGSIYGLVGNNGQGKTTLLKAVLGLIKIDSGEITVNGEKVVFGKINKNIGYVSDVPDFYGFMTADEYLTMCGKISGMSDDKIKNRIKSLLHAVNLDVKNKKISTFSRGMKQRLGIAQALLNSPKILFCDEVTSVLDPSGRKYIMELLKEFNELNKMTIFFVSNSLYEVYHGCTHLAHIQEHKLGFNGKMEELAVKWKQSMKTLPLTIEFFDEYDADKFVDSKWKKTKINETKYLIDVSDRIKILAVMKWLANNNIPVKNMITDNATVEEMLEDILDGMGEGDK